MRRLLPLVILVVAACTQGGAATSAPGQTTSGGQPSVPGATGGGPVPGTNPPAATTAPAGTQSTGVVIPEPCATGFIAYLKSIEPVVSTYDPTTATFGEFFGFEDAARDKGLEAMLETGGATYSCSEVGLEFNYFDMRTPWPSVHQLAAANAPGTVAFLQTLEKVSAIDGAKLEDYAMATCEDAAAKIKADVAAGSSGGLESVDDLGVDGGLALLGLYKAYVANVREGTCTSTLGNDEFGFMGTH